MKAKPVKSLITHLQKYIEFVLSRFFLLHKKIIKCFVQNIAVLILDHFYFSSLLVNPAGINGVRPCEASMQQDIY